MVVSAFRKSQLQEAVISANLDQSLIVDTSSITRLSLNHKCLCRETSES